MLELAVTQTIQITVAQAAGAIAVLGAGIVRQMEQQHVAHPVIHITVKNQGVAGPRKAIAIEQSIAEVLGEYALMLLTILHAIMEISIVALGTILSGARKHKVVGIARTNAMMQSIVMVDGMSAILVPIYAAQAAALLNIAVPRIKSARAMALA